MKKIAKIFLCALLAVSLLCLCACGGKGGTASSSGKKLEGTYILSAITYADGTKLTGDDLKTEMEEVWGMELSETYLQLNGDGTGVLCVYGLPQEIGYENGKFWYSEFLDLGIELEEDILEFDEEGFPIIDTTPTTEATEPTIPEDLKLDFTVSGKTITLDPDGLGDVMAFTKK